MKGEGGMEKYYSNLCETTDLMGYVSRIDNYDMLHVSDYLLKCLGMSKEDYKGKKCHEVIHGKHTPCQFCNNGRLKLGEYDKWYAYNPLLDAHLAVRDTLIEDEEHGTVRMEICYEITNEVKAIQDLQASKSFDKAVSACAKTLLDDVSAKASISELLKTLCNYFAGRYSCIVENQGEIASVTHEHLSEGQGWLKEKFENIPIEMVEDWYEFSDNDDKVYLEKSRFDSDSKQYKMLERSKLNAIIVAPLRKNGMKAGSIIVGEPSINSDDVRLLKTVSAFVETFIEKQRLIEELERLSFADMLTGLQNRNSYEQAIEHYKTHTPDTLGVIFCDVNGLKETNDNLGHDYGDFLIKWSARFLEEAIQGPIYRIGGDEFVALVVDESKEKFQEYIDKINNGLKDLKQVNISVGSQWANENINIDKQLIQADKSMYEVKQAYYENRKYNHMNLRTHYNMIKSELEELKGKYHI